MWAAVPPAAADRIYVNRGYRNGNFFFDSRLGWALSHELGQMELFRGMTPAAATAEYEKYRGTHEWGADLIANANYKCTPATREP